MFSSGEHEQRDRLLAHIKSVLPLPRYEHTVRVWQTAIQLAERYGANRQYAEVAAILHDYAKYRPEAEMKQLIQSESELPNDLLSYNKELWHAFVGAILIKQELGITEPAILNAVRYHTTGRPEMTLEEKVVFVADYIEPGRRFPGVEHVRREALTDLDRAAFLALKQTIDYLERKNEKVYPLTKMAYENLARQNHWT